MNSLISHSKMRFYAALSSLLVGLIVMGMKFYAYKLTNSAAILSDALESIVNVFAASFTLWAVRAAEEPPDSQHPYGHGKIEFVTAVFEGGLITFASFMIAYEAVDTMLKGFPAPNLEQGFWVILLAGAVNGLLGLGLLLAGKATASMALEGDGKHVLSDFLTSGGVIIGLGIVKLTGQNWIDSAIALLMAALLAFTGIPLVKKAISGLIDAADPELLREILQALEQNREPGMIRVHHVRAMRNGRRIHVDGHLVIPEFWSMEMAHDKAEAYQNAIVKNTFFEGEIEFHLDPCRKVYCSQCEIPQCPVRQEPFRQRLKMTIEEVTSPVDITDRRGH